MRRLLLLPLALLAAACVGPLTSDGPSPRVGDHWHASYAITVCQVEMPPFGEVQGGVDSHGDGVIHVHPRTPEDEGKGSRLARLFENAGGALEERLLQLPGQLPWRDGNVCPGGVPGVVMVAVNGEPPIRDLADYVPQDGDRIAIAFVPEAKSLPYPPPARTAAAD